MCGDSHTCPEPGVFMAAGSAADLKIKHGLEGEVQGIMCKTCNMLHFLFCAFRKLGFHKFVIKSCLICFKVLGLTRRSWSVLFPVIIKRPFFILRETVLQQLQCKNLKKINKQIS